MLSNITGGPADLLFEATVLSKYKVAYYRCRETGFIQTEEPYWLGEAYSSAITKLDTGLVSRNIQLSESFSKIIATHFDKTARFLDYAGGYGLFTRLMRDKGFDFYHHDPFCQNLFAEFFDSSKLEPMARYELVTAMEVFEHLSKPKEEIEALFQYSNSILFTTELQPANNSNIQNWWYMGFEHGQHVSLYTKAALEHLAKLYGCNFYTNGSSIHLLTKKSFAQNPFAVLKDPFFTRKLKKLIRRSEKNRFRFPASLAEKDYNNIKASLNSTLP
jgi:hypothetical protein